MEPVWTRWSRHDVGIIGGRSWGIAALVISLPLTSCAVQRPAGQSARSDTQPEEVTQVPLPGSGYVYDVAVADGAVWVTSHAGLYKVDLATNEAANVLPHDYLFRIVAGHRALWITTGSDGHVLRVDPASNSVTAEIDVRAGPVTDLAMSDDAVWASASDHLVRIDPVTNEVVDRLWSRRSFGDIAVDETGLWVIAGPNEEGEVWQIDPATTDVRQRIPLANPSSWNEIAAGNQAVWVTSSPTVHQAGTALVHLYRVDPSTGAITADIPLGDGPSGLGPGEGAASYSALAVGEGSVWALVTWDGLLFDIRSGTSPTESLDGINAGGSDVGPGMTVGAGSIWITASDAVTRIELQD
jgi:hypothetical protein